MTTGKFIGLKCLLGPYAIGWRSFLFATINSQKGVGIARKPRLKVYDNEGALFFQSQGRWLYPLFDFIEHAQVSRTDVSRFSLHDTVVGRAAATVIIVSGVTRVTGDVVSERALSLLKQHGVHVTWKTLVNTIACQTESLLTDVLSLDEAFLLLKKKAKRA